jgi:hypothetical protein
MIVACHNSLIKNLQLISFEALITRRILPFVHSSVCGKYCPFLDEVNQIQYMGFAFPFRHGKTVDSEATLRADFS